MYLYKVRLNSEPDVGTVVTMQATSNEPRCKLTSETTHTFTSENWNQDKEITVQINDDNQYYAKESVSYTCNVQHKMTSTDTIEYASNPLLLDIVSTGCGVGEYLATYDRGVNGTNCICGISHYLPPDSNCLRCPERESTCDAIGLQAPHSRPGFWRSNPKSRDIVAEPFYECPIKSSCLGGNSTVGRCKNGHSDESPLCMVCDNYYALVGQNCMQCPERFDTSVVPAGLAALLVSLLMLFATGVGCVVLGAAISKKTRRAINEALRSDVVKSAAVSNADYIAHSASGSSLQFEQFLNIMWKENVIVTQVEAESLFKVIDTNKNGYISRTELNQYLATIRKRRRSHFGTSSKRKKEHPQRSSMSNKTNMMKLRGIKQLEMIDRSEAGIDEHQPSIAIDVDVDFTVSVPHLHVSTPHLHVPQAPHLKRLEIKFRLMQIGGTLMKVKLLLGFVQCLAFIPSTFVTIPWPDDFLLLSQILSIASIDMFAVFGNVCALYTGYTSRFLAQMMLLPALAMAAFFTNVVVQHCGRRCCRRRYSGTTKESRETRMFNMLFLVVYTLYTR